MIPTQLMFLCLAVATFAPLLMGLRPDWWITYYYGTLFVLWVVLSVVVVRRAASEQQMVERRSDGTARTVTKTGIAPRPHAAAASQPFAGKRLIIVARDQADLYDRISSYETKPSRSSVTAEVLRGAGSQVPTPPIVAGLNDGVTTSPLGSAPGDGPM
jgi:membrane protein implicated in regulation of membrane protease activity